jgi:hypothetical protein
VLIVSCDGGDGILVFRVEIYIRDHRMTILWVRGVDCIRGERGRMREHVGVMMKFEVVACGSGSSVLRHREALCRVVLGRMWSCDFRKAWQQSHGDRAVGKN